MYTWQEAHQLSEEEETEKKKFEIKLKPNIMENSWESEKKTEVDKRYSNSQDNNTVGDK